MPSVRLFVDRAKARGGFVLDADNAHAVAELCRRLDGLPLAIELAAARSPGLSPGELLRALDQRFALLDRGTRGAPARHQTLRAAVEWSHDSLSAEERVVFRRLSAFSGGFSLEAACHVVSADDIPASVVPGILSTLVDKSLLVADRQRADTRYRTLETLREYARERLEEAGEAAVVRRRHIVWYLELTGPRAAFLGASRGHEADPLSDEWDNIRAALQAALDEGDVATALRIINAAGLAYVSEGWTWTDKVLAAAASAPPKLRAQALLVQGTLAFARGNFRDSITPRQEALTIFRDIGDELGTAVSLHYLAAGASLQGDFEAARRLYRESLESWGRSTVKRGYGTAINFALHNLALIALEGDELAQADQHLQEALAVAADLDEEGGVAVHQHALGQLREVEGDLDAAVSWYDRSLALARSIRFPRLIAANLTALGRLALFRDDVASASRHLRQALDVAVSDHDRPGIVHALSGLASVAARRGAWDRAASLLGASDRLLDEVGTRRARPDRQTYERTATVVREQIGNGYHVAWTEGHAWSDEEVVRKARDEATFA